VAEKDTVLQVSQLILDFKTQSQRYFVLEVKCVSQEEAQLVSDVFSSNSPRMRKVWYGEYNLVFE
jgi:hypothetical protein